MNIEKTIKTVKDTASAIMGELDSNSEEQPKFEGYTDVYIETKLAVEFGESKSQSDWVKSLDDELSTISFFAIKEIKSNKAYTWDDCIVSLNNADALVQVNDSYKSKTDIWKKSNTDFFKTDGKPTENAIKELEIFFKSVCDEVDTKIYENSTLVDKGIVTKLASIAQETGARISNFGKLFYAKDSQKEKVLEISIIRFPIKDDPYITLFRIDVEAWFSCNRVLMVENNNSGFNVDVKQVKYNLNKEIKNAISAEHIEKFKAKLDEPDLFDF